MKDMTKNIRSKRRMDTENRWLVTELLAADYEKAWPNPEEEQTIQKWNIWLERMKKEDDKRKMEELHQQKVSQMIKSAEGWCCTPARDDEAHSMESRSTDPEERRRGRQAVGPLSSKEERMGKAMAVWRRCPECGRKDSEK